MKKILLIDDDISSLKGLQMCFSVKHFPTVSATSVSEAQRLLDTEEISLVCTGIYREEDPDWMCWPMLEKEIYPWCF